MFTLGILCSFDVGMLAGEVLEVVVVGGVLLYQARCFCIRWGVVVSGEVLLYRAFGTAQPVDLLARAYTL